MKIEKLFERAKDIKNVELRMEYLRIVGTRAMAERHFEAFKRECERWLDNIYKDGVKREEGEQEEK